MQRWLLVLAVALTLAAGHARAHAAPPEPSGPHPRILLDEPTLASLKSLAKVKNSAVSRAIAKCKTIQDDPKRWAHDSYMGLDWAQHLQACMIAYKATDDKKAGAMAVVYYKAMLDDLSDVGDGKGGNEAVRRDSGFAMRAMGPNTAIAYDWLWDAPGVDEALREKARERFKAWTDWYQEHGYMNRTPAANYHAGYLIGATLIAIAQGSEAGGDGARLWRHVWGTIYAKDMASAMRGGILDGGDWGEGWQYAPLSLVEYALGAREMAKQGLDVEDYGKWLRSILVRHVYALTPGTEEVFVAGDTGESQPNLSPNPLVLAAVILGPAPAEAKSWAKAEMDRLGLNSQTPFILYEVFAETEKVEPVPFPRADSPTWYVASGTSTLHARSTWSPSAVWFVTQCTEHMNIDHSPPNAGNFVIARGDDDIIVDPSPYGSLSSLTSNAPTVENAQFPPDYHPSQGWWGDKEKVRYAWSRQTSSGIIAARCDYADQYKFQQRPSDVPAAMRDFVVVPYNKGTDAMTVVIDRGKSGDKDRGLHLRFRTLADLVLSKDVATGTVGSSQLSIRRLYATGGNSEIKEFSKSDCFKEGVTRGGCDAARFDVTDYRLVVPGPEMEAIHVLDAAPKKAGELPASLVEGKGWKAIVAARGDRNVAVVTSTGKGAGSLSYALPAVAGGVHIVIDGPAAEGARATVTATKQGSDCAVSVAAAKDGSGFDAAPLVFTIDDACAIAEDPTMTKPIAVGGDPARADAGVPVVGNGNGSGSGGGEVGNGSGSAGSGSGSAADPGNAVRPAAGHGCCGAQGASAPVGMSVFVVVGLLVVLRRRDP